jgi:putative ABC transport system permease protein
MKPDWRAALVRHATQAGVDLPAAMVDEMALHLDDLYVAALAEGRSEHEAQARANAALAQSAMSILRDRAERNTRRERARQPIPPPSATRGRSLDVLNAIRHALRQFRLHPTFACVTVLVLGLGAGAAAAVFTVVDAVVLRPLPYAAPDRLVTLWAANTQRGLSHDPTSPVDFMDYRALPVFKDAAAWWRPAVNLRDPGQDPVRVSTIEVSGNLFELLGVRPQIGAGFPAGGPLFRNNDHIAVISDRLWRTRYSANPGVIGRQLDLSGTPFTIVGVMPPRFHYPDDVDVWQRLGWDFRQHYRGARFLESVARLTDDTTPDRAVAAVDALSLRLQGEFASTNKGWSVRVVPLLDETLGYYRPALFVLIGAVGLLFVIACLNVASLLLVRALSREREIAVRITLGATLRQLVVQLLAESLVLSVAGALVGMVTAAASLPLIIALTPVDIPRLDQAGISLRTLGLGLGVIVVTTIFFGLLPALLLLRGRIGASLRSGERGSSRGARRIYSVLVAGEVALACALLVSSALLVRTVGAMMRTPTGVHADEVVTTKVQLDGVAYRNWRGIADTHGQILQALRAQSGIITAGGANFLPLEVGWRMGFGVDGMPPPPRPEDAPQAQYHTITDGYFQAMGAEVVRGREFSASTDTADGAPVIIVNETFATRFLSDGATLGRFVRINASGVGPLGSNLMWKQHAAAPTRFEVVGVVRDIRNAPLGQNVEPAIYFANAQFPFRELFISIRAASRATAIAGISAALKQAAPGVPFGTPRTWGEIRASRTAEPRLLMSVLVFFAGLAALLAAIGVYGLVSWSVVLRTRELAIRLTLGARPASVGTLVLRHGALLVVCGLVAGLALVRLGETLLARVLFDVTASDIGATSTASLLLLVAALIACAPPAWRAMRMDPLEGLRVE